VKAIFSFLRRIARVHDISPVHVGEIAVYDALHDTEEMGSRFDTVPVPRWGFDEDFATLLDSLKASISLAQASNLSRLPLARMIHDLSEGLIGEVVDIVTRAAVTAIESGEERITSRTVMALGYVPLPNSLRCPMPEHNACIRNPPSDDHLRVVCPIGRSCHPAQHDPHERDCPVMLTRHRIRSALPIAGLGSEILTVPSEPAAPRLR
jgi:hypothetical protein